MWVVDQKKYLGEVSQWSRAVQFGDGVFETLKIESGQCKALKYHVQRLSIGLKSLHIAKPHENLSSMLQAYIKDMVNYSGLSEGVLKIIVSRGDSARGYGFDSSLEPRVSVFFSPLQNLPQSNYKQGIKLQNLKTQCSVQTQLAGLKHLNRLENVLAKSELHEAFFEGLMSNHLGYVIEGTMSNVFFERDGTLYTPNLSLSGVKGVMRQQVLECCHHKNIKVVVDNILLDSIFEFESAFICNSLIGILPAASIDENLLKIGEVTRQLQLAMASGGSYE